jgi:hypothetical protein
MPSKDTADATGSLLPGAFFLGAEVRTSKAQQPPPPSPPPVLPPTARRRPKTAAAKRGGAPPAASDGEASELREFRLRFMLNGAGAAR